ncbi:MAG: hypothetical protein JNJ58_02935 [Chitinophagaceae bacterium]|nr:hypothetical protein [Chitinophagaceae bacterium]
MTYDNINVQMSATQLAQLKDAIHQVRNLLPFLINITPEEKKKLGRKAHDRLAFRKYSMQLALQRPELLPPSISMSEWSNDIALYDDLLPIYQNLQQLLEGLSDTLLALRLEGHQSGILFLNILRAHAKTNTMGIDTMVSRLEEALHS